MKAWHWAREDLTLGYNDGRKIVAGETLSVEGKLAICKKGLHASVDILDALYYAPGPIACRVELTDVIENRNKIVGRTRKVLAMVNATKVLKEFSRYCALDVADKWDCPSIVLAWLKTGDESIREAANSAIHSAFYSLGNASYYESNTSYYVISGAYSATNAAYYAVNVSASMANYAASVANYAAEIKNKAKYSAKLEEMVLELFKGQ